MRGLKASRERGSLREKVELQCERGSSTAYVPPVLRVEEHLENHIGDARCTNVQREGVCVVSGWVSSGGRASVWRLRRTSDELWISSGDTRVCTSTRRKTEAPLDAGLHTGCGFRCAA